MPAAPSGDVHLQNILDNLDLNDPPRLTVNLPHLFQNPAGNGRFNPTDPRYVLTYDDPSLTWDNYNIQLSSAVDFMVPTPPSSQPSHQTVQPNARDHGQFAVPPLAQSVSPQYPRLPHPNNSPYGPNPHQNPIVVPGHVVPGHPVSPPI